MYLVLVGGNRVTPEYSTADFAFNKVCAFGPYATWERALGQCINLAEAAIEDCDIDDYRDDAVARIYEQMSALRDPASSPEMQLGAAMLLMLTIYHETIAIVKLEVRE